MGNFLEKNMIPKKYCIKRKNFIEGIVIGVVLLTIFPGLLYAGCPGIDRIKNTVPPGDYRVAFLRIFSEESGKEDALFYLLSIVDGQKPEMVGNKLAFALTDIGVKSLEEVIKDVQTNLSLVNLDPVNLRCEPIVLEGGTAGYAIIGGAQFKAWPKDKGTYYVELTEISSRISTKGSGEGG
jgi:hypothetical protein